MNHSSNFNPPYKGERSESHTTTDIWRVPDTVSHAQGIPSACFPPLRVAGKYEGIFRIGFNACEFPQMIAKHTVQCVSRRTHLTGVRTSLQRQYARHLVSVRFELSFVSDHRKTVHSVANHAY